MRAFTFLWFGQLISLLGTGITWFALTIWAWQETGQATALALVGFFSFLPVVLVSPFAEVFVDRWSRKAILIGSDLAAGLATVVLFVLYTSGNLALWHIYLIALFTSAVESFQLPALSASITMMVPKAQRARANGMRSVAGSVSQIGAPILAGVLLAFQGLQTIFIIDIVTFCFAVLTLLFISIPKLKKEPSSDKPTSVWQEAVVGLRYILERRSLLGLTVVFVCLNFLAMLGLVVLDPMILARTGGDEVVLGTVRSVLGVGGLAGGLLISLWGGPKRKIYGTVLGIVGASLSMAALGLGQNVTVWVVTGFSMLFFIPMIDAFADAIQQNKVPPAVQGRVFATGRAFSQIGTMLAYLLSGFLADLVFEPSLMPGGALTNLFGWLVGTGPGAGMGLMLFFSGLLGTAVGVAALLYTPVRNIEHLLPDHHDLEQSQNMVDEKRG